MLDIDFNNMKKFKTFLFLNCLFLLLSSTTCTEEPNFYTKIIEVENAISIDNKDSYVVNDVVYINALFSRYLPENGFDNILDIYKTTQSNKYTFNFYLDKKNSENIWLNLDFLNNLIIEKGEINFENNTNNYNTNDQFAICVLNNLTNQYEFRAGISILETGEYRLRVLRKLIPKTLNNNINLEIETTINNLEIQEEMYVNYLFSVN